MKKIALFGTSANPPHIRHKEIVEAVIKNKMADEVWIIPTGNHAFGKNLAPAKHRLAMARMIAGVKIKVKDFELKRRGKSYTIYTVKFLQKKFPDYEFFWVFGSDIVANKEYLKWRDWKNLKKRIKFVVWPRRGYPLGRPPAIFRLIKMTPKTNISSTEIRERLAKNQKISHLVPKTVENYIKKYKLYRQ